MRISSPVPSTIACATGTAVRDAGVYALGISAAGRVCWETSLARPPGNSSFPSMPVVAGAVVVFDSAGDVFGVDPISGHQQWRWSSGDAPAVSGFGGGNAVLAAGGGRVIVTKGGYGHETVVGLDQVSGSVAWSQPFPPSRSNVIAGADDSLLFIADPGEVIRAVSDRTGRTLWNGSEPAPSSIGGGLVEVFSPATPAGGSVIEAGTSSVRAVSSTTGAPLWNRPGRINESQYVDGTLLLTPPPGEGAGHYDVPTTAVDPATGRTLWSTAALDPGGSQFFSADGALIHSEATGQSATLERLDPATGDVLWQVPDDAYHVVGASGYVIDLESTGYQTGPASVVGRDPTTGAVRWRAALSPGGVIDDTFVTAGAGASATVVDVHGNELTGIDASTGAIRWHLDLPGGGLALTSAAGGLIVQVLDEQYIIQGH